MRGEKDIFRYVRCQSIYLHAPFIRKLLENVLQQNKGVNRERKNGNGRSKGQVKRIWVIVIGDPGVTTCTRLSRQPSPDSSRPEGSKRKLAKKMECIKNVSLLNAFRGDSDDWQRLGVNLMIT